MGQTWRAMSEPAPPTPPDPSGLVVPEGDDLVPASERAFYVDEFAGETLVASISDPSAATRAAVGRAARSLAEGRGRLLLVIDRTVAEDVATGGILPADPVVLDAPRGGGLRASSIGPEAYGSRCGLASSDVNMRTTGRHVRRLTRLHPEPQSLRTVLLAAHSS